MSFKIGDKVTFPAGNFGTITAVDDSTGDEWVSVLRRGADNSGWWRPERLRAGWAGKRPSSEQGLGLTITELRAWVSLSFSQARDEGDRDGALAYMFVLDQIDERFEL